MFFGRSFNAAFVIRSRPGDFFLAILEMILRTVFGVLNMFDVTIWTLLGFGSSFVILT